MAKTRTAAARTRDRRRQAASRPSFPASGAPPRLIRSDLLRRLSDEDVANVVLLQAPAGHGKTMVLSQVQSAFEASGIRTAWLTLGRTDNDSRVHASHLKTLVTRLAGTGRDRMPPTAPVRGDLGLAHRTAWFTEALIQAQRDVALFIDEFEVLADRSVLRFWREFLQACPPRVRVFIASRSMPDCGLARLLIGGKLLLLGAEDLRFSSSEVREYFSCFDIEISAGEIEAIHRRTEGWPAAVQLFRLGHTNPDARRTLGDLDKFRPRELTEYLTEYVLAAQSVETRRFLHHTSLLPRLNAQLCNHITGRTDSDQVLAKLEREGLFLRPIDPERVWFQYHALFAEVLRDQVAAIDPAKVGELHGRAARWFWGAGLWEEAMQGATAAHDPGLALGILKQWSSRLIVRGEMATVVRWFEHLAPVVSEQDLAFTVRMVWSLVFAGRFKSLARQLEVLESLRAVNAASGQPDDSTIVRAGAAMCADRIEEADRIISEVEPVDRVLEGFEAFEQGAGENLRAYLAMFHGNFAAAHIHLSRARSFNELGDASFSGGYTACFEGALLILEGRVHAALETLRAGLDEQRRVLDATFVSAAIASCYLWALYEADELTLFDAVAEEYREALLDTAVPDFFAAGQLCLARVLASRGRSPEAQRSLDHAQYVAARHGWRRIESMLALERIALLVRADIGAVVRASEAKPLIRDVAGHRSRLTSPAGELMTASLHQVADRLGKRAGIADWTAEGHARNTYGQLQMLLARALRARRAGKARAGQRLFQRAVSIGARSGLVGPFLEHGDSAGAFVRDMMGSEAFPDGSPELRLLARLLTRFGTATADLGLNAGPEAVVRHYDDFTERERAVLHLLAMRLSNKEISRRTSVSENTVKFHLKNIFGKLGVTTRLEAFTAISRLRDARPPPSSPGST